MTQAWRNSWGALLVCGTLATAMPAIAQPVRAAAPAEPEIVRIDPGLNAVLAPEATVKRVATGYKFNEGPMWREGRLWFSDLGGNKMYALSPDGTAEMLIDKAGGLSDPPPGSTLGSNGMVTDRDGTVLMARQGGRTIVRVRRDLSIAPFLSEHQGKKLNSPNDLVFARDGSLWFTDPPFGVPGGDTGPDKQQPYNAVYRYAGGKLTPAITDLALPNGLAFSPDGRTFYVNNYGPDMFTRAYDVGAGGRLTNMRVLFRYTAANGRGGPDGLKVDSTGNVWSTGPGGLYVITPKGKLLGRVRLPEQAANLAFAADGRSLYITASTSIYHVRTLIPGVMPLYRR